VWANDPTQEDLEIKSQILLPRKLKSAAMLPIVCPFREQRKTVIVT
jgi:hypothetical protein